MKVETVGAQPQFATQKKKKKRKKKEGKEGGSNSGRKGVSERTQAIGLGVE